MSPITTTEEVRAIMERFYARMSEMKERDTFPWGHPNPSHLETLQRLLSTPRDPQAQKIDPWDMWWAIAQSELRATLLAACPELIDASYDEIDFFEHFLFFRDPAARENAWFVPLASYRYCGHDFEAADIYYGQFRSGPSRATKVG